MAGHTIDYAALAQQARRGGPPKVDYAALAQQARGSATPPRPAGLPADVDLPGIPVDTPTVRGPQAPTTVGSRLLGNNPVADTTRVVGSHLKNLVAAPYHAFADAPRNAGEQKLIDDNGGNKNPVLAGANRLGLAANRMFVQPTTEALSTAATQAKAGNYGNPMGDYDAEGNYHPSAVSSVVDSIPLAGPWARGIENDAQQNGALPALMGAGTDLIAPKVAGKVASKVLAKSAPFAAETAMKVRGTDRAHGANPGQAIIDDTSGFTPHNIAESGRATMKNLEAEQSGVLSGSPGMVDLTPTQNVVADYASRAAEENHPGTIKDIGKLGDQVHTDYMSGQPLPQQVTPLRAAALNRGISNGKTSWNPATVNGTMDAAAGEMHHQLGESIASVVPEVKPINQRMQSLIPAIQRANAADLHAGIWQQAVGKVVAPTGALAGTIAGWHYGGLPGAAAGMIAPLAFGSPEFQMGLARGANALAPIPQRFLAPATTGAALQYVGQPAGEESKPNDFQAASVVPLDENAVPASVRPPRKKK